MSILYTDATSFSESSHAWSRVAAELHVQLFDRQLMEQLDL